MSELGRPLPPLLRRFGRYELLAKLAQGGMAELFLARRTGAPGVLVIKRPLPYLADEPRFVAMFRDEARIAARIAHANVCKVLEVGEVGETCFMALEYLHGLPLSRILLRALRHASGLDPGLVAALGLGAARGLDAAHRLAGPDGDPLGVVHRDVSPPNLFVTAAGELKLLDFGVVKAMGASQTTRTGTVKGKNAYLSPEQVRSPATVDRRSDVFSLGICMWEALAGRRLFNRDNDFAILRAVVAAEVPGLASVRADLPVELVATVERCLAADADRRFASAGELADALAAGAGAGARPWSTAEVAAFLGHEFASELAGKAELVAAVTSA